MAGFIPPLRTAIARLASSLVNAMKPSAMLPVTDCVIELVFKRRTLKSGIRYSVVLNRNGVKQEMTACYFAKYCHVL
jgi:hypothetical protein